ncbi:MAG TPA: respiratory nitrate reductase subunit gamma [Gaiellaceae bacterium]
MNEFLFIGIPYAAVAICVLGSIVRYRTDRFSITTQSSQFLENRVLFWGSNAWHWGILLILFAHLAPLVAPGWWSRLLGDTVRLYVLEVTGLALAFLAVFGLLLLIGRRLVNERIFAVTSTGDWLLLAVLLFQVAFGIYISIAYRWGGAWYPDTVVPWLRSLVVLQPDASTMTVLPWPVKVHAVGGFALLVLFPYTRLVHAITYPLAYLWRPYQVVLWNRRVASSQPAAVRQAVPRREEQS